VSCINTPSAELSDSKSFIASRSRPQQICLLVLLILIFAAACGGHKTKVKQPIPRPKAATPAKQTEPAKPQAAKTAPPPPVQEKVPEPPVSKPVEPPPATVPVDMEYPASPFIRIGLTIAAKEIRISSTGDYYLTDKKPEAARLRVQGEIQIRVEQEVEETAAAFRIQVASYSNAEKAADLKKTLAAALELPVIVHDNPATGTNQVRVGEFADKEEAQSTLRQLNELGYRDAFLVREEVSTGGGATTLAVRGPQDLYRISRSGFLLQPSSAAAFLCIDGKPYRGLLDVFLNKNGKITAVNQLGTEEYLLGVVPSEISPASYPESAALAAQAIAARTYALKNLGRYKSEGYDLTDDTKTQVYGGVNAEKEATNEAVRQTAGVAIYYQGKLIDAMYMSTCGGRTEDFANVFDAQDVPYLKSVFCAIESGPEKGVTVLEGHHSVDQAMTSDDGSIANRNIELARVLGLIGPEFELSPDSLTGPAKRNEIVRWVESARKIAKKAQQDSPLSLADVETRAGFLRYAAESFFGSGDIRRKLSTRDLEYYIGNLRDGESVPASARYALSYLMQAGLWRPNSDNSARPDAEVRRIDAISLLLSWIESARPDVLQKGAFVAAKVSDTEARQSISVKKGNRAQEYRLSEKLPVFRLDSGRITPVNSMKVIGNEKVSFHVSASGSIDFLEIELSPTGASSDRYSPVATWDTTLSRSAIAEKLRSLVDNIGQFQDLRPSRIGNSGRVTQIQVVGSRRSVVLNGYKVRGILGLKDTLFTITRESYPDGSIASFTFHGRGWGHGIGLCQVGAFGMARAGHGYEEIIKTYYKGVEIQKAY
jgi:stage II sporulation protein D